MGGVYSMEAYTTSMEVNPTLMEAHFLPWKLLEGSMECVI